LIRNPAVNLVCIFGLSAIRKKSSCITLVKRVAGFLHVWQNISISMLLGGIISMSQVRFYVEKKYRVWAGRYDANQRTTIPDFLDHFDELAPVIKKLASIYRFWVAPIDGDKRRRERFEAAMSIHLYNQPGIVGAFQDQGIRYRPRWESEAPLIAKIINYDQIHGTAQCAFFLIVWLE
jgi:hypothetical protein